MVLQASAKYQPKISPSSPKGQELHRLRVPPATRPGSQHLKMAQAPVNEKQNFRSRKFKGKRQAGEVCENESGKSLDFFFFPLKPKGACRSCGQR